jgi:hypothetical protein
MITHRDEQIQEKEIRNEERVGGETESNAQTGQGKETKEEMVQHTVTRVEEQTPNLDEAEMETQDEFKEVIYGRNQRRQRHQVMMTHTGVCIPMNVRYSTTVRFNS